MMNTDLLGAVTAVVFYGLAILVFATRLCGKPQVGHRLGAAMFLLAVPLVYLLIAAPGDHRPALYYVQIGLLLLWMAVELLLDYILKTDFRRIRRMVIGYVVLFFAGSGGMLGVAAYTGRGWSMVSIALFLIMAALAFVQRKKTGM
jgi:hypothetical protein